MFILNKFLLAFGIKNGPLGFSHIFKVRKWHAFQFRQYHCLCHKVLMKTLSPIIHSILFRFDISKSLFLNSSFIKQSADWRFAGKERGSRLSCQNHAFKIFVQGSSSGSSNREECWRGTKVWCTFLPLQNLALAANSIKGIFSGATDLDHFKYLVVNSFKARSGSVSFPQFYSVPRREFSESHFLIGISCFSSL